MTVRRLVVLCGVAAGLAACAQAEPSGDCAEEECHAECFPRFGACAAGRCVCSQPDGGDADADTGPCTDAACAEWCRGAGHTGGMCLGDACQCAGTPPDADVPDAPDAPDVPDLPEAPEVREDASGEEARPDEGAGEDAPRDDGAADEATPADVGDPCTIDDLVEQLICGSGMKCTFQDLIGTRPDPICDREGRRLVNTTCAHASASDTCEAGLLCLNDGSDNRCRRLCRDDADCAVLGPRAGCLVNMTFDGTTVDGIRSCTISCDIFTHTGCDDSQACRPAFPEGALTSYTDCSHAGTGGQEADCSTDGSADCQRGYQCFVVGGTDNQCLRLCHLSGGLSECLAVGASACQDIGDPDGVVGACL